MTSSLWTGKNWPWLKTYFYVQCYQKYIHQTEQINQFSLLCRPHASSASLTRRILVRGAEFLCSWLARIRGWFVRQSPGWCRFESNYVAQRNLIQNDPLSLLLFDLYRVAWDLVPETDPLWLLFLALRRVAWALVSKKGSLISRSTRIVIIARSAVRLWICGVAVLDTRIAIRRFLKRTRCRRWRGNRRAGITSLVSVFRGFLHLFE